MRPTEKLPKLEEPIGAVFHYASNAIRRGLDNAIAAEVSPELTGVRGMVLHYIVRCTSEGKPVYQRDIETRFRVQRSSVTVLLQAMEQADFITRRAVERDARLKSLAPTQKGLACNDALDACICRYETSLRQGIPPEQLETTYALIVHLMDNLRQMERKEGS